LEMNVTVTPVGSVFVAGPPTPPPPPSPVDPGFLELDSATTYNVHDGIFDHFVGQMLEFDGAQDPVADENEQFDDFLERWAV